jgi:hypothetical protein
VIKPQRTAALDKETKDTSGRKVTLTAAMAGAIGGVFGVTTATLTGTTSRAGEASSSSEQKRFTSRITQQGMRGVVRWGFNIDDPYEREGGIDMSDANLPSVKFEFFGTSNDPPSPPNHINVEVASYWSIITSSGHDLSWLNKLLSTASKTGSYSNLCQMVALKVPSNLSKRCHYMAVLHVNSGYRLEVTLPSSVEVTPAIRFGDDGTPIESRKYS